MEPHTMKKTNVSSIIIYAIVIVAGIIVTLLGFPYAKGIGSLLIIIGILALSLCKKQETYHLKSGSKVTRLIYYFPPIEKNRLMTMCQNKEFDMLHKIKQTKHGLQMEINISSNGEYGSIQLYEYVPHRYHECSPLFEYEGEDSKNLLHYISTLSV